jgi:hypothetical protein
MRLLAVLLIAFAMPLPALANGSPCGSPPTLANAEAARALSAAVRADLGAAPLETSFLEQARQTVDELAAKHDLSRAAVVARYVYHICEALYARGSEGEQLSQVLSRVQQALDVTAQVDKAEEDTAPGAAGGSAPMPEAQASAPAASEPADPTTETSETSVTQPAPADKPAEDAAPDADEGTAPVQGTEAAATAEAEKRVAPTDTKSAPVVTKSFKAPATQGKRAPQPNVRRFQYRAAPRATQDGAGISQFAAPQNRNMTIQRNAPVIGGGAAAPRIATPPNAMPPRTAPAPMAAAPQAPAAVAPAQPEPAEQAVAEPQEAPAPASDTSRDPAAEMAEAPDSMTSEAESSGTDNVASAPDGNTGATTAQAETTAQQSAAPQPETVRAPNATTATAEANRAPASARPAAQAEGAQDQAACPERGVLGPECFDVDEALEDLRDRPVEYNHPQQMIRGQATEITLALRTDFTAEGLPEEASEAFEGLQGEVKQQRAKIANIMSARLRGRDFEVDPKGMQERTVTWRRPVEWSWYVTPKAGGEDKRLELELYAHIVNPQGETQPPVLIKTLDATIDVDVRTLDWLIEQAKTFEPIYAVVAAIIGFFTALITLWFRRRPAHPGDGPPSGITTAPTPPQRRVSDMSAGEAAAEAARKRQDEGGSDGRG